MSRVSPNKLNSSTFSIIFVLIIVGVSVLPFLLCIWNNIYLILAILSDRLFISSHSLILKKFFIYQEMWINVWCIGKVTNCVEECCIICII